MGLRYLIVLCVLAGVPGISCAQTYLAGGSEWQPFSYTDDQGLLQGISVDITREVFNRAQIDARMVSYPVNRLQAMLDKGQIDINYAESRSWKEPQEASRYLFSIPYLKVREHLYFAVGHPAADTPPEELQDLTIGMVRGYTYRKLDAGFEFKRLQKLETSQDTALLQLLHNGRVDAVALVDDLYDHLAATGQIDPKRFQRGAQLSEAPLSIMLQSKHAALLPAIDKAIRKLQASGEIARIHDAHLPSRTALACNAPDHKC